MCALPRTGSSLSRTTTDKSTSCRATPRKRRASILLKAFPDMTPEEKRARRRPVAHTLGRQCFAPWPRTRQSCASSYMTRPTNIAVASVRSPLSPWLSPAQTGPTTIAVDSRSPAAEPGRSQREADLLRIPVVPPVHGRSPERVTKIRWLAFGERNTGGTVLQRARSDGQEKPSCGDSVV